jgi:hypothetical protein
VATVPSAEACLTANTSSIEVTQNLAKDVNKFGKFKAVIHNQFEPSYHPSRARTADGLPFVFAMNSRAPYILTCLIEKPKRLVYLTSAMHNSGNSTLQDFKLNSKPTSGLKPPPTRACIISYWRTPFRDAGLTFYPTLLRLGRK